MPTVVKEARRAMRRVTSQIRQGIISGSPPWLRSSLGLPAAYFELLFLDHGIFRSVYLNRHRVSKGVWRAAQPSPLHIGGFAREGVRTLLNLRGERNCSSYDLERAACERHGVKLVNYQVRSRAAPSVKEIKGIVRLFDQVEYPLVMHCKSGADRTGLVSVLYRYVKDGEPMELAKQQLSLRYGHIRQADTGILDYFFERYIADNLVRPMPFMQWVEEVYDPVELKQTFQSSTWANRLVNTVLQRE